MDDLYSAVFEGSSLLFDCYPGGNDTFVFCNRKVGRSSYGRLDQVIRSRYPHFEQGAVLERTRRDRAVVRVQMIGGEFSPNTVRSVAALIADLYCRDRKAIPFAHMDLVKVSRECISFPLEVSGTKKIMQASVWAAGDQWHVELEMADAGSVRIHRSLPLKFDDEECRCDLVFLEGMTQVLIPESEVPFVRSRLTLFRRIVAARQQLGLQSCPAFSLVWWSDQGGQRKIQPVSYVTKSDVCIDETGSGAAAVALAVARDDGHACGIESIQQPSGIEIKVRTEPSIRGMSPARVYLSGPVQLRGELNSSYEAPRYAVNRRFYLVR